MSLVHSFGKQSRQFQVFTKVLHSSRKRTFYAGVNASNICNTRSGLMKKAKPKFPNRYVKSINCACTDSWLCPFRQSYKTRDLEINEDNMLMGDPFVPQQFLIKGYMNLSKFMKMTCHWEYYGNYRSSKYMV